MMYKSKEHHDWIQYLKKKRREDRQQLNKERFALLRSKYKELKRDCFAVNGDMAILCHVVDNEGNYGMFIGRS